MTKQTFKANIISPGRSTLKFPQNYILASILNESPNYFGPVIVCCCSGKRCNYLRQCVSKYVGHNSRAWVERATQLFLCAAVSGSHHRFHLWLHSWLLNSSNLSTISRGRNTDKTRGISLFCAHEWVFLKPQSPTVLCTDAGVDSNSMSQAAVRGKNDLMSPFLSTAISFSLLWHAAVHISKAYFWKHAHFES